MKGFAQKINGPENAEEKSPFRKTALSSGGVTRRRPSTRESMSIAARSTGIPLVAVYNIRL